MPNWRPWGGAFRSRPAPIGGFRVEEGLVGQIEVAGNRSPMVCRRSDRDQLRRMVP